MQKKPRRKMCCQCSWSLSSAPPAPRLLFSLTRRNSNSFTVRSGSCNWTKLVSQFSLPNRQMDRCSYFTLIISCLLKVQSNRDKQRSQLTKRIKTMPSKTLCEALKDAQCGSRCWRRQAFIIHHDEQDVSLQCQQ